MAVGDNTFPLMPAIAGCELGVAAAGIRYPNRNDLLVIRFAEQATATGAFTQNAFCAAPVSLCRESLSKSTASRGFIINSGNANACTGEQGMSDAIQSCATLASYLQCQPEQVLPFSTGVIGEHLNMPALLSGLPLACDNLTADNWRVAAESIMTTDTFPKGASSSFELDGVPLTINGICKGAGMIRPNMATMLAFIVTDAVIAEPVLKQIHLRAVQKSFNRVSVDGDTSTNDSCMLVATGAANMSPIDSIEDRRLAPLQTQLIQLYQQLAQLIVRDGEGATKFISIVVQSGKTEAECLAVGYALAHSPLVKTALFASDPNWGRIVCAIGYADVEAFNANQVKVWANDILIVENGGPAATYTEDQGQAVFNAEEIELRIDLGRGSEQEQLWTCDFSHEYVSINADYRS